MASSGVTEAELEEVLRTTLTPSDTIKTLEHLFGRGKSFTTIRHALNSPGRQIFIYGDREVGKTSLALTATYLFNRARSEPIVVRCGSTSSFSDVLQSIGNQCVPLFKAYDPHSWRFQTPMRPRWAGMTSQSDF